MNALTLVIGNKNLSSWSLRPWLFLRHHQVGFTETTVALDAADARARILEHSPTGKVPLLRHGEVRVWESLAICEYAAEVLALPDAWPQDPAARGLARAIACEMHAGFADLRRELPLNCSRPPAPIACSAAAQADIARVRAIWRQAREQSRERHRGDWLFGAFGIADAMYAPVALRFEVYHVALDGPEREYAKALLEHPAVGEWRRGAAAEQQK